MAVEIHPAKTSTQFHFFLNKKTDGDVHYYPKKKEVVVDFNYATKKFDLKNAKLAGSNIESISSKNKLPGKVRFIIKVKKPIVWRIKFNTDAKTKKSTLKLTITNSTSAKKPDVLDIFKKQPARKKVKEVKKTQKVVVKHKKQKQPKKAKRLITVVIDPGHGGKDSGAIGPTGRYEKDVVLAISKRLARHINKIPGMKAVLTRKGDYYVPLRKRLRLARSGDADIFIAVHADAFYNKRVRGASVYALSKRGATSEAARWLAKQNRYAELDDIALNSLQDRSRTLRSVLIDLAQTATNRESILLGSTMLDELDDVSALKKTKVEQAAFVVLKSPDIPSILVETGFISNPYEEKRLANPYYQEKLARAMARGLKKYYRL